MAAGAISQRTERVEAETGDAVVIVSSLLPAAPRGLGRVSVCPVSPYGRSAGSDVQSSFEGSSGSTPVFAAYRGVLHVGATLVRPGGG